MDKPLLGTPARLVLADPDADANLELMVLDLKWLGHGHSDHLGNGLGIEQVVIGEQQHELVTGQSGEEALVVEAAGDPLRQLAEDGIAMAVAKAVVDLFEVVEIAKQQAAGVGAAYLRLQPLHQAQAVGQAGERVLPCQLQYLLFPLLAQGNLAIEPFVAHQQVDRQQQYEHAGSQTQQKPGAPEYPLLGGGLIEKVSQRHGSLDEPDFGQLLHDVGDAIRVHIPDLHIERLYHLLAYLQLVLHVGLTAVDAVFTAQQGDGLLGMGEGIAPPFKAGGPKPLYPARMGLLLRLSGEEYVAVKVDAVIARVDDGDGNAALFQIERLVAEIGVEDIDPALDEIIDIDRGLDRGKLAFIETLIEKCRQQLGILMGGKHHDPFATHAINSENAAVTTGQEDGRRVLKDAGERQQWLAIGIGGQYLCVADAKVGTTALHLVHRAYSLATGPYLHVQSGFGIEALGLGHVIAHKLGLVQPAQLEHHPLRGFKGGFIGQEGPDITGANQQQPKQVSLHPCDSCSEYSWGGDPLMESYSCNETHSKRL